MTKVMLGTAFALLASALFASALFSIGACASGSSGNPLCTCASTEKFDGHQCVAAADFVAPTGCTDDGTSVCGCDGKGYTSTCAAYTAGVEVQYGGACHAGAGGGGGGFGW